MERGVAAGACVLVRPFVDFSRINRGRSVDVRGPLRLSDDDRVLLLLPPIRRDAGHFTAVWAALLVHVIRPDLHIIVPTATREAHRLRRLARSVRRNDAMRFPGERFTLPELLGAADLAMFLPPDDASVASLPWAMAAGRPILGSATYAVTELLADRHNGWLCKPDDPKAAAQKLLRLMEAPVNETRGPVELARAQAFEVFGRERMIQQYRQVYDNLRLDRPAAEGISDSAVRT
jgi:glycosyltransferase involved in cell wall biosynthesis